MGNTIILFLDKYYEYGVGPDPERQGLTIGGFKSAFLADLEASYIIDKLKYIWERHVQFLAPIAMMKSLYSMAKKWMSGL